MRFKIVSLPSSSVQLPGKIRKKADIIAWLQNNSSELRRYLKETPSYFKTTYDYGFYTFAHGETDKERLKLCLQSLYNEVLFGIPRFIEIKHDKYMDKKRYGLEELFSEAISLWMNWKAETEHCRSSTISYENTPQGKRKFIKDCFKFYFHAIHKWTRAGYGEFMTGDYAGALLAARNKDSRMNIKFLSGNKGSQHQHASSQKAPSIKRRIGDDKHRVNSSSHDQIFRAYHGDRMIVYSFPNEKEPYKGVAKAFGERYANGSNELKREAPKKPWNVHVAHTTTAVQAWTKKTGAESIAQLIKNDFFQYLKENEKQLIRKDFESYNIPEGSFVLWGRRSGHHGAAHKETDSDPVIWGQIIKHLQQKYPSTKIVLIGDEMDLRGIDDSTVIAINEYWKKSEFGDIYQKSKMCQDYFNSLLVEKKCVVIGMKSGNHHVMVGLGGKIIYFDDKESNHTGAEREESFSGKSSRGRELHCKDPANIQKALSREIKKSGVYPKYRRLATEAQLGYYSDYMDVVSSTRENLTILSDILSYQSIPQFSPKETLDQFLERVEEKLNYILAAFVDKKSSLSQKNQRINKSLLELCEFIQRYKLVQEPIAPLISLEDFPLDSKHKALKEQLSKTIASLKKVPLFRRVIIVQRLQGISENMKKASQHGQLNDKAIEKWKREIDALDADSHRPKKEYVLKVKGCNRRLHRIHSRLNIWSQQIGLKEHELTQLDVLIETLNVLEKKEEAEAKKLTAWLDRFSI